MTASQNVSVIHLCSKETIGEAVAIQSPEFLGPRLRFVCSIPLNADASFVYLAPGSQIAWVKYAVTACEPREDGSALILARPDGWFEPSPPTSE